MCNFYFLYCPDPAKTSAARNKLFSNATRVRARFIIYPYDFNLADMPEQFKQMKVGIDPRMPGFYAIVYTDTDAAVFERQIEAILLEGCNYQHLYSQNPSLMSWFNSKCKVQGFRSVVHRTSYGMVRTSTIAVKNPAKRSKKDPLAEQFEEEMREMQQPTMQQVWDACVREAGKKFGDRMLAIQLSWLQTHELQLKRYSKSQYMIRWGRDPRGFYASYAYDIERLIEQFWKDYHDLYYKKETDYEHLASTMFRERKKKVMQEKGWDIDFSNVDTALYTFRRYLKEDWPQENPGYRMCAIDWSHYEFHKYIMSKVMPYEDWLRKQKPKIAKKPIVVVLPRK